MTETATAIPQTTRVLAMLLHLGGILLLFLPSLITYLTLQDRTTFLGRQSRAALNYQLAVLAALLIGFLTLWLLVGFYIVPAVAVANAVFCSLAATDALRGDPARYLVRLPIVD